SSISGERGSFDPIYAAAKGAIMPFAKSLATWLGDRVSVVVVAPGLIEGSAMHDDMAPERRDHHRDATPRGELLSQEGFASLLADLAGAHWAHVNGAVIRVNGGAYV
ncbi:MAG: SDR family oxidoreductase, partial [Caulobacterales bacterium]|nr:SDR family oxidoreductase [Caulobacterales bacterium]